MIIDKIEEIISKGQRDERTEINLIRDFVHEYRNKYHILPTSGRKLELSGIAFGEGYNLLYRQLILTNDGEDGWKELDNSEVRILVLEQIKKDILRN